MEYLTPSHLRDKSPFKDVTNSTPTPGFGAGSPRKITKSSRHKRINSVTTSPQRRSTRLSSLKAEPQGKENKDDDSQTTTKKQKRKVTPRTGSSITRKKSESRERQEMSESRGRRTRTSASTLPSSPLAGKTTPSKLLATPNRLRITRSNSSSSQIDGTIQSLRREGIPIISETPLEEDEEPQSPTHQNDTSQPTQQHNLSPSPAPFNEFPLPLSPVKPIRTAAPLETPHRRQTPLPRHSAVKAVLHENDVFAISPGMFPRSVKRTDYLDFFADSDRKAFQSPLTLTASSPIVAPPAFEEATMRVSDRNPNIEDESKEDLITADNFKNELLNDETSHVDAHEGDHPHFALLSYLAEVASVTEHLPEQKVEELPLEEDLAHGGIEGILTAAALAESMKEELFAETENVVIPDKNGSCSQDEQPPATDSMHEDPLVTGISTEESKEVTELDTETNNTQALPQISKPVTIPQNTETVDSENPELESSFSLPVQSSEFPTIVDVQTNEVEQEMDDDWEELITYSEIDETKEFGLDDKEQESKEILVGESTNSRLDREDSNAVLTAGATNGLDEMEEIVSSKITIFEDLPEAKNLPVTQERESLSSQVIFSIPQEKDLISSPPKRQISSSYEQENVHLPCSDLSDRKKYGLKKRKTASNLPNTTRLDVLRKRAMRVRSREARHNIKRRDFTAALQPVLDNLPSPESKMSLLKNTPALIPPSLRAKRLQSPVTPAPSKRTRLEAEQGAMVKSPSPLKPALAERETLSPRKRIIIHPSPVKGTPKPEFKFNFDKTEKTTQEPLGKATPRYEVYSKIFGPPPQISKNLIEKDSTTTLTQSLDTEFPRLKSPTRKHRVIDIESRSKKKAESEPTALSALGRPVRSETFAVPSLPVPPGPPQLPPSIQRNNNKRFTSVLPSPAQPPPSVIRSGLPRPAGFGSTSTAAGTRRSTRLPKVPEPPKSIANVAVSSIPSQPVIPEKKPNGPEVVSEKFTALAVDIPAPDNVTMERPKGKLGGAQRVNRNGDAKKDGENKRVDVSTRPTRPQTPPLISLSKKELQALTDNNTKKNEGFKTVNLQPTVKRVNKKRPAEPSDEFAVGKGAKWSKGEALPEWDRGIIDPQGTIRWKSPRFMTKPERRGAIRVKGILKKKERERIDKEDEIVGMQCEPLVVQRFVYKGEK